MQTPCEASNRSEIVGLQHISVIVFIIVLDSDVFVSFRSLFFITLIKRILYTRTVAPFAPASFPTRFPPIDLLLNKFLHFFSCATADVANKANFIGGNRLNRYQGIPSLNVRNPLTPAFKRNLPDRVSCLFP